MQYTLPEVKKTVVAGVAGVVTVVATFIALNMLHGSALRYGTFIVVAAGALGVVPATVFKAKNKEVKPDPIDWNAPLALPPQEPLVVQPKDWDELIVQAAEHAANSAIAGIADTLGKVIDERIDLGQPETPVAETPPVVVTEPTPEPEPEPEPEIDTTPDLPGDGEHVAIFFDTPPIEVEASELEEAAK